MQADSPVFSVVIVNFNGGPYLQAAIDSLAAQTRRDFELILADNASTDGSAESADLSGLPAARLIRNPDNRGFAAANNQAATLAKGRWLVLLNPDARAEPDWLAALGEAAEAHPEARVFTSAQFRMDDPSRLDGAGDAYLIFGFPWRGGYGRPAADLPAEDGWCFSACGAAAMYDRALFLQLGGFDERFFCYCEDVDLGFRLQRAGHDCRFVRGAIVEHAGSGIAGAESAFATYHGTRNRLWTYVKNMPLPVLLLTLPGHLVLILYLLARNLFTPRFRPMVRGLSDGLKGLAHIIRDRRWKTRLANAGLVRLLSRMAWNPWRMSARKVHIRDRGGL